MSLCVVNSNFLKKQLVSLASQIKPFVQCPGMNYASSYIFTNISLFCIVFFINRTYIYACYVIKVTLSKLAFNGLDTGSFINRFDF